MVLQRTASKRFDINFNNGSQPSTDNDNWATVTAIAWQKTTTIGDAEDAEEARSSNTHGTMVNSYIYIYIMRTWCMVLAHLHTNEVDDDEWKAFTNPKLYLKEFIWSYVFDRVTGTDRPRPSTISTVSTLIARAYVGTDRISNTIGAHIT